MVERLKGKGAVVTGSGRGIGRAIALALAEEGASVVVNDPGGAIDGSGHDVTPADEVVAEIKKGGGIAVANCDTVAEFKAAEKIIKTCMDNFGRLDILVNVAGIERARMIYNMSEEDWLTVLGVHLNGTFYCCRHACGLMRQQRSGRIINTVSSAWLGTVGHVNYGASKGGIVSLTRAVAREMGRYGVTCNAIAPAAATRFTLTPEVLDGFRKRYEAGIITKEYYESLIDMPAPEYVAPIVVYLSSDEAANVNGQVFSTAGGTVGIYSNPVVTNSIHRDYKKTGKWTLDELIELVPKMLLVDYVNPAPPEAAEKKKT
ncbi:SDR family oxidoreductase [Chloroflexota bacterium]